MVLCLPTLIKKTLKKIETLRQAHRHCTLPPALLRVAASPCSSLLTGSGLRLDPRRRAAVASGEEAGQLHLHHLQICFVAFRSASEMQEEEELWWWWWWCPVQEGAVVVVVPDARGGGPT